MFVFLFFLLGHMTTRLNTQHDSLQFSSSPPSPSPSLDYSIVSHPSPSPDRDATLYASHPARSQPYLCSTRCSGSTPRDRDKRTNALHGSSPSYHIVAGGNRAPQTGKSMKFLLPRLWGALSSPTRKARRQTARRKPYTLPSNISYADLQPLDGEEGELIDEACYVERYDSTQSPRNLIGPRFHSLSLLA
jgi:F-box and WD-40 domain protein 1/11